MSAHNTQARKRLIPNVSCITVAHGCSEDNPGTIDYFDVPLEDYTSGCLTGAHIMAELLKEAACNPYGLYLLPGVLQACAAEMDSEVEVSKRGAAIGLLDTLQEVVNYAATRLDFAPMFKPLFDCHEGILADGLADLRQRNAAVLADIAGYPLTGGAA